MNPTTSRKILIALLAMAFALPHGMATAAEEKMSVDTFSDDNGKYYEVAIETIAASGVTAGCTTDGTRYCPDSPVTRAQMAVFIIKAMGLQPTKPTGDPFVDVPLSQWGWAAGYIERMAWLGITSGCNPDGTRFCPDQGVTRAQMAIFIIKALGIPPTEPTGDPFVDVPLSQWSWAAGYIERMAWLGITSGCNPDGTRFCPDQVVTRGQMAVFLARMMALRPSAMPPAARENAALYYQTIDSQEEADKLGKVRLILGGGLTGLPYIKNTGAKAYTYTQYFWFPDDRVYEGIDISAHMDWTFRDQDCNPIVGREQPAGVNWYFMNVNHPDLYLHLKAQMELKKAAGWDGVFLDRGWASMVGADHAVAPIWDKVSRMDCLDILASPLDPNRTFADGYVQVARAAKEAGLEVLMNYGASPFDPKIPMRPNPRDPDCAIRNGNLLDRNWSACSTLGDAWWFAHHTLNEAVAHPKDYFWSNDYEANRRTEAKGSPVVGLITKGTLTDPYSGVADLSRENVYYEWSRVKLFRIPMAVFTGDDGCGGADFCNRHGIYKELAETTFGDPLTPEPRKVACQSGHNCVWYRPYKGGMVLVNVSDSPKTVTLPVGLPGCAYVKNLYSGQVLGGNSCLTRVTVTLGAWRGHPLVYKSSPW